MNRDIPTVGIVVPCYNEERMLPCTIAALTKMLGTLQEGRQVSAQSFLLFVDDGSKDTTWKTIEDASSNPLIQGVKLSFNAGHQAALMAGMMEAREQVDCIISIDADLQHDLGVIPEMLRLFSCGSDIVTGIRRNRAGDSYLKAVGSNFFYKVMQVLGTPLAPQQADFRLVSRSVLDALSCYPERNVFLRGIIASMGFSTATVEYTQSERTLGESKYSLAKMLSLAWNGITSFSSMPLRISAVLSLFTLLLALLIAISTLVDFFSGNTVSGWSSLMLSILFIGSIQLFCMAILGEYIAKIYIEVKRRPYYIIEKKL